MKIGIIGRGFVGSAVEYGFSEKSGWNAEIRIYDKDKTKSTHSLNETINESDYIFLSVPTPSNKDGSIHLDIIYSALEEINKINKRKDNIVLIRSTVTPGTTNEIQKSFPNLNIVFNPEFLTEKNANSDFINQSRVILGGNKDHTNKIAKLFKERFGDDLPVIQTNYETAEFIKYMNNCFLATKVSFMNEMKLIANESEVNWETAIEGFTKDERVGKSHIQVPGPDGKFGFGGSCFPKDMQAMIHFSKEKHIEPNVLEGAWKTNLEVRPDQDWKELKGRSIIDED
ncbi:UDP-glucose/GDP-mannose dehydrogenase family protein [Candidatus Woesearchaeota archaeon]|jgi:UDPglucose 6-dehydrogenase|nr:UDP-glucose/GDP-mannose dehydrogenase family protein [Candidatus Woesearchaeota archaeon]MBT6735153.1 UDP-glucose/GDP-mannose dehydrogenase family protein [Candidatus Woesearchaeota archaeon]MBT7474404.1 UDP-glucose/GDP-mannose dehydrogenase family protein [Candidatus Woesearchaeota archaeon]